MHDESVVSEQLENLSIEESPLVVDSETTDSDASGDVVAVVEQVNADTGAKLDDISLRLDKLGRGVQALAEGDAADTASDSASAVLIDDAQWQEMRDAWGWCKSGFSVALYLSVILTLLVAALLGSRLWSAFSKGWRS